MHHKLFGLALVLCLVAGIAPNTNPCDDGNPCTNDVYDSQYQRCTNLALSYGTVCGTGMICDGKGTCIASAPVACAREQECLTLEDGKLRGCTKVFTATGSPILCSSTTASVAYCHTCPSPVCGNTILEGNEQCEACPTCPIGSTSCPACRLYCDQGKSCDLKTCTCVSSTTTTPACGDGQCGVNEGETHYSCPRDCPCQLWVGLAPEMPWTYGSPAKFRITVHGISESPLSAKVTFYDSTGNARDVLLQQGTTTPVFADLSATIDRPAPGAPIQVFLTFCNQGYSCNGQTCVGEAQPVITQCPSGCSCLSSRDAYAKGLSEPCQICAEVQCDATGACETPCQTVYCGKDASGEELKCFKTTQTPGAQCPQDCSCMTKTEARMRGFDLCGGIMKSCEPSMTGESRYCFGPKGQQPPVAQCPVGCSCITRADARMRLGTDSLEQFMCHTEVCGHDTVSPTTGQEILMQVPKYCFKVSQEPFYKECPQDCECMGAQSAREQGLVPCSFPSDSLPLVCARNEQGEEKYCFKKPPVGYNTCQQSGGFCINMYGECPTGSSSSDLSCDSPSSKCCRKEGTSVLACESICKEKCETVCDGTVPDCMVSFDQECYKTCMQYCTPGQVVPGQPPVTQDTGELTKALNRVADLLERLINLLNVFFGQSKA